MARGLPYAGEYLPLGYRIRRRGGLKRDRRSSRRGIPHVGVVPAGYRLSKHGVLRPDKRSIRAGILPNAPELYASQSTYTKDALRGIYSRPSFVTLIKYRIARFLFGGF